MLVLDEPAWTANIGYALRASISADILITSGSAGLVFRYVDSNNYYRLLLKASGGAPLEQAVFSVKNGVATKIANMSFALQTGATYTIGVSVQGSSISISWSGQSRMNVTNADSTYGSVGFVADGVATVLKFSMTTDCDAGNNCLGAFPGASCTHSCAAGYQLAGTLYFEEIRDAEGRIDEAALRHWCSAFLDWMRSGKLGRAVSAGDNNQATMADVRAVRPDVAFGADLIAGFPTETEGMFENTLKLVEEAGLAFLHVFPYSARPGTPAAKMPQVARDVIKARAAQLDRKSVV